jgi:peptidase M28-like protein
MTRTNTALAVEPVTGRELLLEILSWARPHDSDTEHRFVRSFIDIVPGMEQDEFGNRFVRIGESNIMWSCHVDTVSAKGGYRQLAFDEDTGVIGLADGKAGQSLGADDGAGVWIMLEMIRAGRPGLYVFHRGEEHGCLGSRWASIHTPDLFKGIDAAVAFDRAHYADVITHQSFGRTCSDAFAVSMADQLNSIHRQAVSKPWFTYQPDDTGMYTDTNEYAAIVPECSNLSVGYFDQHGPRETLDIFHVEALRDVMLSFDATKLVIERDPADMSEAYGWKNWEDYAPVTPHSELLDLVYEYPDEVATLLDSLGVEPKDIRAIIAQNRRDDADKKAWGLSDDDLRWEDVEER